MHFFYGHVWYVWIDKNVKKIMEFPFGAGGGHLSEMRAFEARAIFPLFLNGAVGSVKGWDDGHGGSTPMGCKILGMMYEGVL